MTKAAAEGAGAVIISAEIESEVAQLESEEEKKEFLASLGLEETGLAKSSGQVTNFWGWKPILPPGRKKCVPGHF